MPKAKVIHAVGKRKVAVARAVLKPGKGVVRINSVPVDVWGPKYLVEKIKEPLQIAGSVAKKVDIDVVVQSGGVSSQADAVRTAIGRALAEYGGDKLKKAFVEYDRSIVVPDMRQNEPWKAGRSKPRAAAQKSKR